MSSSRNFFFKGLDELRGIAAVAVVFHHVELFKNREGIPSFYNTFLNQFVGRLGKNGVYLFFVLSGFLITYLLLQELKRNNNLDIKKFYIRRILRIWPLYYLIVILCFFALPVIVHAFPEFFGENYYSSLIMSLHKNFIAVLAFFLLFFPNLAFLIYKPVAGASQSWSVGVEEQFYIVWPLLLGFFKKNILKLLIGVICVKFLLLFAVNIWMLLSEDSMIDLLYSFLKSFNIELMALGGLGAYLLDRGKLNRLLGGGAKKWYGKILLVLILFFLVFNIDYFVLSLLFLFLILLNINEHTFVVRSKILASLGKISYGIYMFHPIFMFVAYVVISKIINQKQVILFSMLFFGVTFLLTIVISHLSFKYFESFFLRKRNKYT